MNEVGHIADEDEQSYLAFVLLNIQPRGEWRSKFPTWQTYKGKELKVMKYGEVVELKQMVRAANVESQLKMVNMVFGIPMKYLYRMRIADFFALFNWVAERLELIIKGERANLTSEPDAVATQAGIDRLERFGVVALIDELADGDVLKWSAIEDMEYRYVFTKLCLNKVKADITKDMEAIMKRQRQSRTKRKW